MKILTWAAVAVTALFALMNLGAVPQSESETPYRVIAAVLGLAGAAAAIGLAAKQQWGRPAVIAVGALNAIISITGFFTDQEGAVTGLVVGGLGVVLGLLAAHPDQMRAALDIQPLFAFTFVPGVIALFVVCRRAKPMFTAILGTLGILGALAGTFNPAIDLFVLLGLKEGIDHDQLAALSDAVENSQLTWTLLFTLLFITVGRIATGVLLWKAKVGPRPLAVLMAATPFIEFGGDQLPGLGNIAPASAWIASGIAMLGVTATLLRMPNDEFDLPPRESSPSPGR